MLPFLVIIACLQLIESNNLALTFDANNSVCTASCTTCSSDTNAAPSLTGYNHTFIMEILNATMINGQAIKETKEAIDGIIRSLSLIKDTNTANAGAINDILLLVEDLVALHNDTSFGPSPLPTSCEEIKNKQPASPSGVYLLATGNETIHVYCSMEELCGSGGGWTRLAYLDMSDATQNCPSGFRLYQSGEVKTCGRPVSVSASCVSVKFLSNGISYSQVCGRVVGYQYGSPDAVHGGSHNNLNGEYVDGISITRGSPRQHVWTLMAGNFEALYNGNLNCPCSVNGEVQPFIGSNYYCESGNPRLTYPWSSFILYTADPLWDGKGCGSLETACCSVPGIPWFHRDYGNTTTSDYLELRVCGNEGTDNEDVPVSHYEIYVK